MNLFLLFITLFSLSFLSYSETFQGHCRDRPPELIPDNSTCKGPVPEIIATALRRLGHEISWTDVPWKRSILTAINGDVDILPRHSMKKEREEFLNAVAYGYRVRKVYYMISPILDIDVDTFEDLSPYQIGMLRGSFYSEQFDQADSLKKNTFSTTEQLIQMLKMGRIDIAVTSSAHGEERYRAIPGIKEAKYVDQFYNSRNISIPKKSTMAKYFPSFKAEIERMAKSGEVSKIFTDLGIPPPAQKN